MEDARREAEAGARELGKQRHQEDIRNAHVWFTEPLSGKIHEGWREGSMPRDSGEKTVDAEKGPPAPSP